MAASTVPTATCRHQHQSRGTRRRPVLASPAVAPPSTSHGFSTLLLAELTRHLHDAGVMTTPEEEVAFDLLSQSW